MEATCSEKLEIHQLTVAMPVHADSRQKYVQVLLD